MAEICYKKNLLSFLPLIDVNVIFIKKIPNFSHPLMIMQIPSSMHNWTKEIHALRITSTTFCGISLKYLIWNNLLQMLLRFSYVSHQYMDSQKGRCLPTVLFGLILPLIKSNIKALSLLLILTSAIQTKQQDHHFLHDEGRFCEIFAEPTRRSKQWENALLDFTLCLEQWRESASAWELVGSDFCVFGLLYIASSYYLKNIRNYLQHKSSRLSRIMDSGEKKLQGLPQEVSVDGEIFKLELGYQF